MTEGWARAMRALSALAVDPGGLGGLCLRARAGPVRRAFEDACQTLPAPRARLTPSDPEDRLHGGLDVVRSLAERRTVRSSGLAGSPGTLILAMAERAPPDYAARLAQLLDRRAGHTLILLDEGAEPEEHAPAPLTERLAFHVTLDDLGWRDTGPPPESGLLDKARTRLAKLPHDADHAALLTAAAARFGIDSLRAPLFALRAARALAALDGAEAVTDTQLQEAAELVFAARATRRPESSEDDPPPPDRPGPEHKDDPDTRPGDPENLPEDLLVAAIAASLPAKLLDESDRPAPGTRSGGGAGARRKGNRRGRPLPSRPGRPDGQSRIDLIATLRAAAPLQTLRRQALPEDSGRRVIVYPSDIRLKRYENRSDRLLIFAVDASGSAAMARMAVAKGAVELFLARAYARRDHVALVAFRGEGADLLLPPTRSLVQAKRRLAELPGGGGTPLAAGLMTVATVAAAGRHQGLSPALVVLTDGRSNIGLDGTPGRDIAREDSRRAAALLRKEGLPGVLIDTSLRPREDGTDLAGWLGARYLALPRADAQTMCDRAGAALDG